MAQAELSTINALLKNKDIGILYQGGSVDDLFVAYRDVWDSIKEYHNRHSDVPGIEVMQAKFPDLETVEVPAKTEYYLDELRSNYVGARVDTIITKAAQAMKNGDAPGAVLEKLQTTLAKLNKFSGTAQDANIMDTEEALRHYEEVKAKSDALGGLPGIPTGVAFIDSAYTSGLAPGDLVVVLGWTGRAKSLFTTYVACNTWDMGYKPMIASLEMRYQKVRDRVYTILGSGMFTNSGLAIGDVDMNSFGKFRAKTEGKPEFIVVTNEAGGELTPNVIEAKIDQHKPRLVIVDYAQLASDNANSTSMPERMMNMSKELKRLAVKKEVCIMLISSATAESATSSDTPPTIEQVAWSRQLAYDADLAFAVHKFDDSNLISIVCRKNRNGPLFAGYLDWDIDKGIVKETFKK